MPSNTQSPTIPGVPIEFQNPTTPVLVLDSEVSGTDISTGLPLTREFVVPIESISGQTSEEVITHLLTRILVELRMMRQIMEAEAVPHIVDEPEDILPSDEPETEAEES